VLALVLGTGVVYLVAAITSPWAFHIGGRFTPLLYWSGYGKLATKNGTYPLYISFFPSSSFSRLQLDGLRPTGGVRGTATLCTAPGITQALHISGTIYGGWKSTENSLMDMRLLETRYIDLGQHRGYFDLYGRWNGPDLVMDDGNAWASVFKSGLKIEHASVTLRWGSYKDFMAMCASGTDSKQ
jgi:hypothetical protein